MKKRILSLFLVVCLIISALPSGVFASEILYGDVNSDGEINMRDVLALKRFIAGSGNSIDEIAADVTCDSLIDEADVALLKKQIAGWDVLLGLPYFDVTFNSNGGSAVDAVRVRQGDLIAAVPTPAKDNAVFLGWFTDSELNNQFYAEDPIMADLTLYAKYAATENRQQAADNTFTLTDQAPALSFSLQCSDPLKNEQAVLNGLTLENIGNSDYINLVVTGGNGVFTVTADGGFKEGAGYQLTLNDDTLTYADRAASYRICTFTIAKDEVIDIVLNDDLKYIQSSELSDILSNGLPVDELAVAVLGNTDIDVTGSFTYTGAAALQVGDTLCIYTNVKPEDRDTTTDYTDDLIAYVEVTAINGTTVSFMSASAEDVLALPDTLPIEEADLTVYDANGSFTANTSSLDFAQYTELGLTAQTTVDSGDYLVITELDSDVVYGEVVSVTVNGGSIAVSFSLTTSEEILGTTLDYYTVNDVDGNVLLDDANVPELEQKVAAQTVESGFAQDALNYLAYAATQTDSFQNITGVENFIMKNADGSAVNPGDIDLQQLGAVSNSNDITVTAQISTNTQHFGKGLRIAVSVVGVIGIDVGEENEISIELSATFVEEVKVTFTADGGAVWKWWGIFPYISDYTMNANIDVYNFTGIGLKAVITLQEQEGEEETIDISDELGNLMESQDESEITAGVQNLFEAYGEMLKNETDYVTLVEKNLFEKKGHVDKLCIIAYEFKIDFVVNVNLNLALGCNLEYMSGTRYNFWFAIKAKTAGNSTMDLIDETFSFQFYVMGHLGIRVGLKFGFAVGLFCIDLASIGIEAEVGAYVELFGYFFYQYDSVREQGNSQAETTSVMCGALYLEFGIYLEIKFKAQAFNEKYVYNPTLYEHQWPLLWAGVQINVYDFGYLQPPEDDVVLIKDVTSLELPDSIRYMNCLDLKEGDLSVNEYGLEKFYYSLSNNKFTLNEATGVVTVTVPDNVRYMECDLTITWKSDKLAFSSNGLTRTIHLVWTNLTSTELQEKYDVSVKVGNNVVWTARVNRGVVPVLPTEAEILELIGYNRYLSGDTNLKYTGYTGYGTQTATPVTGKQTYTFGVTEREYTLTVDGVQNPNGTTKSLSFTAKFGENFNLSALADTGTAIAGTTFTRYLKTDCSSLTGKPVGAKIDTAFATQLLNNTFSYTAQYTDDSCVVTYIFYTTDGNAIPSVTEIIKKGTIPVFDYTDYLINQYDGYIASDWDITIDKVSANTAFTTLCSTPTGEKRVITFNSNGGSSAEPIESYKGAAISPPVVPVRVGYDFAGWCTDEQLTNVYTFTKMPDYSFTLYAAWTANEYTLTFDPNGGECETSTATVTYGSSYGTLPTPILTGFAFEGWYTALTGGTLIESTAVVATAVDQQLFARWREKTVISISSTVQRKTYNKNAQAFEFNANGVTGFTVQYLKTGAPEWSDTAVNYGEYAVKITRAEDNNYKKFDETVSGKFFIDKASRTIGAPAVTVLNRTITATQITNHAGYPDGTVEYAVSTTATIPTTGWTTGRSFVNLIANRLYYVFSRVSEGTNYLAANSAGRTATTGAKVAAQGSAADGYVYYSGIIETADVSNAGTDAGNIVMKFKYRDDSESAVNVMSPDNDMERGTDTNYTIKSNRDPWMVSQFGIANLGKGSYAGWHGGYLYYTPYPGSSVRIVSVSAWYDDNYGTYTWLTIIGSRFKRTITAFGDFADWGGSYTVDSAASGTIDFTYNGNVTDQYGTYNALAHEDSPQLSVISSLAGYDECFSYSMNSLSIDKAALYQKMAENNVAQIVLTAGLTVDARSSNTAGPVNTITINRQ